MLEHILEEADNGNMREVL